MLTINPPAAAPNQHVVRKRDEEIPDHITDTLFQDDEWHVASRSAEMTHGACGDYPFGHIG